MADYSMKSDRESRPKYPSRPAGGVEVLVDHARKDKPVQPRHCACRGCRLGHGHNPAVPR